MSTIKYINLLLLGLLLAACGNKGALTMPPAESSDAPAATTAQEEAAPSVQPADDVEQAQTEEQTD